MSSTTNNRHRYRHVDDGDGWKLYRGDDPDTRRCHLLRTSEMVLMTLSGGVYETPPTSNIDDMSKRTNEIARRAGPSAREVISKMAARDTREGNVLRDPSRGEGDFKTPRLVTRPGGECFSFRHVDGETSHFLELYLNYGAQLSALFKLTAGNINAHTPGRQLI
ncbi:hypothetical protein EVAR_73777_1 [Eumeta japonica]|uniref:Uncharacterized protein n=1 Tax=Eumeta variegata TaxID=151549 RepID=A0A4C1ZVI6_EUMVA|nr:hypothetical protein EVAR_73777_1 [Eumeta japonica]